MTDIARQLERIAASYGIRDVYAFGSRVEEIAGRARGASQVADSAGEANPASDVDIAVQPGAGRRLDARDKVRVAAELEDLFAAQRVDLVVLGEASPFLAVEVIRGELLYTADPTAQAEHELYILRRAADLAPFEAERVRMILSGGGR